MTGKAGSWVTVVGWLGLLVYYCTFIAPDWTTTRWFGVTVSLGDFFLMLVAIGFVADTLRDPKFDTLDLVTVALFFWLGVCLGFGIINHQSVTNSAWATAARTVLMFLSLLPLRRLHERQVNIVFIGSAIVAVIVMLVNLYVQATNDAYLQFTLYYSLQDQGDDFARGATWAIQYGKAVWFDGVVLGLVAAVGGMFYYVTQRSSRSSQIAAALVACICACGIVATLSRALWIVLLGVAAPWAVVSAFRRKMYTKILACTAVAVIGCAAAAAMFVPAINRNYGNLSLVDTMAAKWWAFARDADVSDDSLDRVLDGLAAMDEVLARPLIGNGYPGLIANRRGARGFDVNPWLLVVLAGGFPAFALSVALIGVSLRKKRYVLGSDKGAFLRPALVVLLVLFTMNKTQGLCAPRSLLPLLLLVGLMSPHPQCVKLNVERQRLVNRATDLYRSNRNRRIC